MPPRPTILFAGGGTGGHIFPSVAVLERLREAAAPLDPMFAVSNRPLDSDILGEMGLPFTVLPVRPFTQKLWLWAQFLHGWFFSVTAIEQLIHSLNVVAVVAMGGFVSAPAVAAARRRRIPAALVNLDAVPGRANRRMARKASIVFSAYASPHLPGARLIGVPLPRRALAPGNPAESRRALGLDPQLNTLFITGGSQGAQSVNRAMIELARLPAIQQAMGASSVPRPSSAVAETNPPAPDSSTSPHHDITTSPDAPWQIYHLTGDKDLDAVRAAYAAVNLPAKVERFTTAMGFAWDAATLAITRAGANTVAEAWMNTVPTIFLPYPYHKDQHQKFNAQPLDHLGAGLLLTDQIDPAANARTLTQPLLSLLHDAPRRARMRDLLRQHQPPDGAAVLADWLLHQAGSVPIGWTPGSPRKPMGTDPLNRQAPKAG